MTAKTIRVDWRKCDKSRSSWFQSLRLIGLETRVVCWTNHGAACLGVVIWSRQQTERKTKLSKIKAILHYFWDSIVNSSNFILFFGWIKALSMSPTTTRLYSFLFSVLSVVLKEVCSLNPRLHLLKKCKFCALKL